MEKDVVHKICKAYIIAGALTFEIRINATELMAKGHILHLVITLVINW